jgi:type I restriction enzyme S subunit
MSSKSKTTATKEEAAPALVPKLRFPEFRKAAGWEQKTGNRLFDQINDRRPEPGLPVLAITQEHGAIPRHMIDYHVSVTEKSIESYKVIQVGDFIISLRSFQGGIEYSQYHGICSPAYVILRKRGEGSDAYFKHYLKTDRFIQILTKNLEGLRDGKMVSYAQFSELLIPVPSPPEQQKIAECLSSVDELMAAQARKLGALKTHKKGLMQQLFPREGETQPRLRFPEFQYAGVWVQKTLGGMCRIRTGKKDANEGAVDGIYPFFTCAEKHIYSHNYSFDAEAILIAGNANVGQTNYYHGKFEAYQRTYVLTDFEDIFVPYLYSVLNANLRPDLLAQVQTSAMSYIRLPMLEEYQINAPPTEAEQQRIATCLSSLDALITAQTQKLEALKTHKQGLMQQLFPSPEEVEA